QAFHMSPAERKTLLVSGAAGGMAAVFGTPVAAALLAVELLLFEWKPRSFIPVACAAAVAAAVRVPLLGSGPLFPVTPHALLAWPELLAALGLGIVAGFGSGLLPWLVYAYEDLFRKLPVHWMWWPLLGGAVVGLGGLLYPRALGVGYDTIHDLLTGRLVGVAPVGLLLTKAVIWAAALGSGTSGGVLAPLLIMGGSLGALAAPWIPAGDAGLWAAISMGAMMGGTMRSPFTAVVFVLELTHDVNVLEHEVELLPVVSRDDPTRVVGYVERSGIMAAWVAATRAEGMREEGWLTGHLQALQERVKQALTGAR